jgi:rod shape-determining protein MreC
MARVLDARNSRLLLGALVLAHLVAISRQVDGGGGASLLERLVFAALSPFQRGAGGLVRSVSDTWHGYVDLRGVREENRRLNERLRVVETLLQERQHQARESERLRDLLELRQILPLESVVAEIVTREGVPWFRSIVVNKGRDNGVELEAPVISPSGVVGRVIEVGPMAAKVQLLLDGASGVGVRIERSRVTGVVSGPVDLDAGSTDLVMKYVPALAEISVGDVVVTSGLDRVFPKGLVVGRVRSVGPGAGLFKEILVAPSARFGEIEEVLILRGPRPDTQLTEAVR